MSYQLTSADLLIIGNAARTRIADLEREVAKLLEWKGRVEAAIASHHGCNSYDCGNCIGDIESDLEELKLL